MYRKILALVLVCVMLLGIVGCKKKNKETDESISQTTAVTDESVDTFPMDGLSGACLDGSNTEETEPKATFGADVKVEISLTPSPNEEDDDDIDNPAYETSVATKPSDDKADDTKPGNDKEDNTKPGKDDDTEIEKPGNGETDPVKPGDDENESELDAPDRKNPTAEDYEWYIGLSGAEQFAFMESFLPDYNAFNEWFNAAKEAYDEIYGGEEIGGAVDGGNIG